MSAIIDRNMTSASTVHVLLCIIQSGTACIGYERDFSAADAHVLSLYSQKSPLRGEFFSKDLNRGGIFSPFPTSIQGIFLQLHIWPLLSLSLLCLWHALSLFLWWLRAVELCVFWWELNCKTPLELHMILIFPASSNISCATMSSHIWLTASNLFPSTQLCFGNIATPTSLADWTPSKLNPDLSLWLSPLALFIFL